MCFYNDSDGWIARVHNTIEGNACLVLDCDECGGTIQPGEWYRLDEYQEYQPYDENGEPLDIGQITDETDWDDEDGNPHTGRPESSTVYTCAMCERLRNAIREVEEAEGCSSNEAVPMRGTMYEEVQNGNGWEHYAYQYSILHPGEYLPWPFDLNDYEEWLIEEFEPSGKQQYGAPSQPGHYWCDTYGHSLAHCDEGDGG